MISQTSPTRSFFPIVSQAEQAGQLLLTESIKHPPPLVQTFGRRLDAFVSLAAPPLPPIRPLLGCLAAPPLTPNSNVVGVVGQAGGDAKLDTYRYTPTLELGGWGGKAIWVTL